LGINDISSTTTDLLICKDSFQFSEITYISFSTGWNNAIGSFGAGTNGDDTQDTYHT
jgi:hypothetical protein